MFFNILGFFQKYFNSFFFLAGLFNILYNKIFICLYSVSYIIFTKYLDKGFFEKLGPYGIYKFSRFFGLRSYVLAPSVMFFSIFIMFFSIFMMFF